MQEEKLSEQLEDAKFQKNNVALDPEEIEAIKRNHAIKCRNSKAKQEDFFENITKKIYETSKEFDIDQNASAKDSVFDAMVSSSVIQKSLESDSLIYLEGARLAYQPEFVSVE